MTDEELEKAVDARLITTKRAAEIIGYAHPESVIKPIKLGKLKAFYFDSTYWMVFKSDAERFSRERRKEDSQDSKD